MDRIDFDRNGWTVDIREEDGLMQIRGRSPRNTQHLLLHVVRIDNAGQLGGPAIATNSDGRRVSLETAIDG